MGINLEGSRMRIHTQGRTRRGCIGWRHDLSYNPCVNQSVLSLSVFYDSCPFQMALSKPFSNKDKPTENDKMGDSYMSYWVYISKVNQSSTIQPRTDARSEFRSVGVLKYPTGASAIAV